MATKKRRMYVPPKPAKPKIPEALKAAVKCKADDFVESFLRPQFIKDSPKDCGWLSNEMENRKQKLSPYFLTGWVPFARPLVVSYSISAHSGYTDSPAGFGKYLLQSFLR